jgi:hypothetical protein
MNSKEIEDVFFDNHAEHGEFDRVMNKKHSRRDIHAFLLLAEILDPSEENIVGCVMHDKIGLNADIGDLEDRITEDQVIELIRCGVFLGEGYLMMYA